MPVELFVPIYLNQRIVFDMIAMIEDGFSHLQTVQTSRKRGSSSEGGAESEIGSSNIFAFLGVKLKGHVSGKKDNEEQSVATQERIHTPSSLFSKLYQRLTDDSSIVYLSSSTSTKLSDLKPGNIVEISGLLHKSPLLNLLEHALRMAEMLNMLPDSPQEASSDQPPSDSPDQKKSTLIESPPLASQIRSMIQELRAGEAVDLVCSLADHSAIRAVIPVYQTYFFNQTMSEVIDGEYRVLGKVTRVVPREVDGTINLFRYSGLGLYEQRILNQMLSQLEGLKGAGLQIGEITPVIKAPALQLIPIAIFV